MCLYLIYPEIFTTTIISIDLSSNIIVSIFTMVFTKIDLTNNSSSLLDVIVAIFTITIMVTNSMGSVSFSTITLVVSEVEATIIPTTSKSILISTTSKNVPFLVLDRSFVDTSPTTIVDIISIAFLGLT